MKYRFLLRPGWLAALVALLALTVAFVSLGLWQFGRAHRTHKLSAAQIAARATPVPVERLLENGDLAGGDSVGHAVTVAGVFDDAHQLLVPDRELDGRTGYLVITPLKSTDGHAFVVSRGWTAQPVIPDAPTGPVTVTGWLAAPEPADGATPRAVTEAAADPAHRIASVDIATLVNTWPYTLDQAYVNETDAGTGGLAPVPQPAPPNKSSWYILNLGYTLQWWLFGIVALWWFATYVRRIANPTEDLEDPEDPEDPEDEGNEVSPPAPAPEPESAR